jgi:hypothetical protein
MQSILAVGLVAVCSSAIAAEQQLPTKFLGTWQSEQIGLTCKPGFLIDAAVLASRGEECLIDRVVYADPAGDAAEMLISCRAPKGAPYTGQVAIISAGEGALVILATPVVSRDAETHSTRCPE